jgi:succinate-acetate transporter protein
VRAGGYVGVLTALVARYASAAGVMNGHKGRQIVPSARR